MILDYFFMILFFYPIVSEWIHFWLQQKKTVMNGCGYGSVRSNLFSQILLFGQIRDRNLDPDPAGSYNLCLQDPGIR